MKYAEVIFFIYWPMQLIILTRYSLGFVFTPHTLLAVFLNPSLERPFQSSILFPPSLIVCHLKFFFSPFFYQSITIFIWSVCIEPGPWIWWLWRGVVAECLWLTACGILEDVSPWHSPVVEMRVGSSAKWVWRESEYHPSHVRPTSPSLVIFCSDYKYLIVRRLLRSLLFILPSSWSFLFLFCVHLFICHCDPSRKSTVSAASGTDHY